MFCFSQVVTDILHLHGQKLNAYKGDYDTYERTRIELVKNQQKAFEANERSRTHMQVFHHTIMTKWCYYALSCCRDIYGSLTTLLTCCPYYFVLFPHSYCFGIGIYGSLCLFRPVITNLIFMVNIFFRLVFFFSGIFCVQHSV